MKLGKERAHDYKIHLANGTVISRGWRDHSEEALVKYGDSMKRVHLSKTSVSKIEFSFGRLKTELEVPKDCKVYHSVKSRASLIGNETVNKVIGATVGLVKNGEIVEERYLDYLTNEIIGFRK